MFPDAFYYSYFLVIHSQFFEVVMQVSEVGAVVKVQTRRVGGGGFSG